MEVYWWFIMVKKEPTELVAVSTLTCPPKIGPSDELVFFYNSPAKGVTLSSPHFLVQLVS